jgi:DNA-directed RNA polymerase alpha subunit
MISFNGPRPTFTTAAPLRSTDEAALDALLLPEFESELRDEEPLDTEWPDDEPVPVSAFRPPVLAPDVLTLPATMTERVEMHLAEIGLCDRTLNTLEEAGLHLVGELLNCRPEQLLAIPKCGPATLDEVYHALAGIGFHKKS